MLPLSTPSLDSCGSPQRRLFSGTPHPANPHTTPNAATPANRQLPTPARPFFIIVESCGPLRFPNCSHEPTTSSSSSPFPTDISHPEDRFTVDEALYHPYFDSLR
ncbi:hypothetical protein KSP40_PGU015558 [Platanthera guangdongensis]|uniref:Uncharacterized protein n=1 Tax=Platanthera guangdongensis TaxID=2320717 RepID=A0ABR2MG77_9ASPA